MGGRDEAKGSLDHRKKIEDSEGMCVSEGDYDSCWSRMCNPDRNGALRDVLRGLLVLIALAIVVTIIFLLCFFLLNDMEKKEEALVDSLIEDFTTGNRIDVEPEFSIKGEDAASDKDSYNPLNLPGFGVSDPPDQSHDSKVADFTQQGASSPQNNAPDSIFTALDPGHSLPPKQDFNPSQSPPDSDLARTDDNSFVSSFVPEPELEEDIFDTVTYFTEEESGAECVPLRLPICSGFMPWTITSFPNFVNNNNMNELQESLKYFQSTIVGSHCSNRAAEYSCAVLEPACGPDAKPLPPCRAFCEDIFSSCSEFLATDNVHNVAFDCNRFPDSKNPNDCVDVSRGQVNHTKEELPQSREAPTATSSSNFGFENPSTSANPDTPLTEVNSEDTVSDLMITKEETPASQTDGANFSDANNEEISTGGEVSVVPALETTKPVEPKTEIGTEAEAGQELTAEPKEESIPVDIFEPTDSTEPPVFICDHTKFLCDDGSDCLFEDSVCDGIQHCLDNSDELNCTQPEISTPTITSLGTTSVRPSKRISSPFSNKEEGTPFSTLRQDTREPSRRPSLSEILSGSSLVAVPSQPTEPPEVAVPKKFRFEELKAKRGKAIDSAADRRNNFETFGPSPFTPKPTPHTEEEEKFSKSSSKLSLASLLSSTAMAKVKPPPPPPTTEPDYYYYDDEALEEGEQLPLPSQRTLSALLSSSMPSFSTQVRSTPKKCTEFQCIDGSCVPLDFVGDGIVDCPDGSDETSTNDISLITPKR